MAGGFSPQLLEEIRARVDIVDLVGQFVNLKRAGENWKGLCPFHAEKTPSFMVHPKKGIFHCFGCGVGGDAFGFLMRQDRLQFPEAVRVLAERAGVALPTERRTEVDGQREALFKTMAQASEFYQDALWNRPEGEGARRYLDSRGIAPEMARRFVLGYAPEGWDHLLGFMKGRGVTEEQLVQVGLILPRQTGSGVYDPFRGRLLLPIKDGQGRVVAFGGRAMGTEDPKYLNSPETPLYVKGQTLYAFDLAKPQIREKNRALVVEGYVDCLMAHQHGFTETFPALRTPFPPPPRPRVPRLAARSPPPLLRRGHHLLRRRCGGEESHPARGGATRARHPRACVGSEPDRHVRGRIGPPPQGRAPALGPRPRQLSPEGRRPGLHPEDRRGAEPPGLRRGDRDRRGEHDGPAGQGHGLRARGPDPGQGHGLPGGHRTRPRRRPEARRGPDPALDRGPAAPGRSPKAGPRDRAGPRRRG